MRRYRPIAALAALLLAATPVGAQDDAAEDAAPAPVLVEMGTGSISGVYFPVGVALCRLVNQHRRDTGVRCAARPTGGSVANLAGLRDGSLGLALVQSDLQAAAAAGDPPFADAGPFADLRAVMALHREPLTLVARGDAGIARVEDLAGKRVWIGAEASGTRALAGQLMAALGWTEASFEAPPPVGPDGLGDALCAGDLDAFLFTIGHPALVVQEATTACDARLVPIDGAAIDALLAARPALALTTIPAGLYRGNPDAVASFGVVATLVTRADQPQARVHAMTAQILDDIAMLRGLDPVLAALDPQTISDGITAPLHPGAEAYFRERGWLD